MRSRMPGIVLPSDIGEFADEVRRLFAELGRAAATDPLAGECSPPIDVYETDDSLEVTVDLPGVQAQSVRVVIKAGSVLVVGEKSPRRGRGDSSFHLVERGFGRFARLVRLSVACDAGRARAVLVDGELRLSIPKVVERRGRALAVPITTERPVA